MEFFHVERFEQPADRAFPGHVALPPGVGPGPATQLPALPMVETFGKFGNRVRSLAVGTNGQGHQAQQAGQGVPFALGLAWIGEVIAQSLPQRMQPFGGHRTGGWQGLLVGGQRGRQFRGAQLRQRLGLERPHPEFFGMLRVGVKVLPVPFTTLGRAQALPARGAVTGALEALRINEGLHRQHRMPEMLLPICG